MLATYADDTAILASDDDPNTAANSLQNHLNEIELWASTGKIKKIQKNRSRYYLRCAKKIFPSFIFRALLFQHQTKLNTLV
jgi:hypothetical protein